MWRTGAEVVTYLADLFELCVRELERQTKCLDAHFDDATSLAKAGSAIDLRRIFENALGPRAGVELVRETGHRWARHGCSDETLERVKLHRFCFVARVM